MTKIAISDNDIRAVLDVEQFDFPKYTTQLINLANQNAQGTRPKVVGQMTDLIQEFPGRAYDEWKEWYLDRYPLAIDDATKRIKGMIDSLKTAIEKIDDSLVREWVTDLVLIKTFTGLKFQEAILKKVSEYFKTSYKKSNPIEESIGIDGYIDGKPVSIKPDTYKIKSSLAEKLPDRIIYYSKSKTGITIDFDFTV